VLVNDLRTERGHLADPIGKSEQVFVVFGWVAPRSQVENGYGGLVTLANIVGLNVWLQQII
jgi:hypothetical protein